MGFPNKIIQDIAVAVLQQNAYFSHHENILLAMLIMITMSVLLQSIKYLASEYPRKIWIMLVVMKK